MALLMFPGDAGKKENSTTDEKATKYISGIFGIQELCDITGQYANATKWLRGWAKNHSVPSSNFPTVVNLLGSFRQTALTQKLHSQMQ